MRKILFLMVFIFSAGIMSAQDGKVMLKAGTQIPLQVSNAVEAASVKVGQKIAFTVSRDVMVDGKTVIPFGTLAQGTVYEAKRSSWWGTKGRLGIKIDDLVLPNSENALAPLTNNNIYVTGKNRTPLSVITFLFVWPGCFICGSKAELPASYTTIANVASSVEISTK